MIRFGVLVVFVLCLSFSKEDEGQEVLAGDCGYNAYYKCVLNCFQDVFGLTQTGGEFCAGTVQIRGPKKSYSTQDVGNTLKCISGNCRSVVRPSVCSPPTDFPSSSASSVLDGPFPTAPPSAPTAPSGALAPNGASSFASINNFEPPDDSEDCEDEDYPASNPLFSQRSGDLPLIRKARSSDSSTPSTNPLSESTPDTSGSTETGTTSATSSTGTTGSTSSPETSTGSSLQTSGSTGGSTASAGSGESTVPLTGTSDSTSSSVKTSMNTMDDCDEEDKNIQSASATDSDECNNDSESSTTENGSSTTSPASTASPLSSSEVTSTPVYSTTAVSSSKMPSSTPLSSSTVLLSSTVLSSSTATPISSTVSSTATESSSSTTSSGSTVNTTPSSITGLFKSTLPPPVMNRPALSSRNVDAPVLTDEDCEEDVETNNDAASAVAFSPGSGTVVASAADEDKNTYTEESNYNSSDYYYDYYDDYYYDNETYSYYDENEDPAENFRETTEISNADAENVIKSEIIPTDRNSQTGSSYTNYRNMPQTSNNLYDGNNNFGQNNINKARSVGYLETGPNLQALNENEIQYLLRNALRNNGAYQPLPINHNYPIGLNNFPIPGQAPIPFNRYQPFPIIPIQQQPAMQNPGGQQSQYGNIARSGIFPTNQFGFGWPLNLPLTRGSNFKPSFNFGNSRSIYSLSSNAGPATREQYPGNSGNNRFKNIGTGNGNSGQPLRLGVGNQFM